MPSPEISDDRKIANSHSPEQQADLVAARKQIKNAFRASMVLGGFMLFQWLTIPGLKTTNDGAWLLINAPIFLGLGYGISRNNALCAKLMFGYYLLSTIISIANIIQIANGVFITFAFILIRGFILRYFWLGIVGTNRYHELRETTETNDLPTVAPEINTQSNQPTTSAPKPFQPLEPTSELLSLCGGDRAQAQWLLSQIKIKHPSRSLDWYNQKAIHELTSKTTDLQDED
jgi:hypothetical protein